jgi:RNA polymerase sigma-70 factor (ECF subfamily)
MSDGTDDRGSSARFDAGELLRHATWLRALARALVRPDDVDDVVQEAWVAALARPPRSALALRTWLERVVHNVARQLSRSTIRRARREQSSASHEPLPPTADVVARAALHKDLVGRVLALDEPTRSVVLLRFFDGLRAAEIAKRVGASEEAVRQRLKRGLDRLREQLDADHGGKREEWLGGFAALASGAGAAAWTVTKVQVALAAGVLAMAGAGWFWWRSTPVGRPAPKVAAAAAVPTPGDPAAPAPAATSTTSGAAKSESVHDESREATRESTVPDALPVHFVYGALVADDGATMEKVSLSVGALSADEARAPTHQQPWDFYGERGSYAVAGLEPGRYRLHAEREGFATIEREFTVAPDVEALRLDLVFAHKIVVPVRLLAPDGRRLADAVAADDPDFPLYHLAVLALPTIPTAPLPLTDGCMEMRATLAQWIVPTGRFARNGSDEMPPPEGCDGVLLIEGAAPFHAVAALKNVVVGSTFVAKPDDAGGGIALTVDPAAIRAALATVRVRCVMGRDARPVVGASLRMSDSQNWGQFEAKTDADGVAVFSHVAPGILTCEFGMWEFEARVEPAGVTDLGTFDLEPAQSVAGKVVDEHGKELDGRTSWIDIGRWGPGMPLDDRWSFASDPAGGIRVMLARSRYLVHAVGSDIAENRLLVDLTAGSTAPIEVHVAHGALVHFEDRGTTPLLPTIFEITTKEGTPVYSRFGIGDLRLLPGEYRLTARREREALAQLDFTVGNELTTVALPELPGPSRTTTKRGGDATESGESPLLSRLPRDPVGTVVYGRVVGPSAADLQEGWIAAIGMDQRLIDDRLRRGCYAFAGVTPGRAELTASGSNRLGRVEWIDIPAAPHVFRHDFSPAGRRTIAVVLVDAATGEPLRLIASDPEMRGSGSRFDVVATEDPLQLGESDADVEASGNARVGRFAWGASSRFENVSSAGTLELRQDGEAFASLTCGDRVVATERVAATADRIEFRVDHDAIDAALAKLRVRLVDATTGVALTPTAFHVVSPGWVSGKSRDASTPVDDAGTREIAGLAPVESKVIIEVADHERIEHSVRLVAGLNDLGTLELGTTRKVRGRVVDGDGRPVVCKVVVEDVGRGSSRRALTLSRRFLSATDGSFEFEVGRSTYEIRVDDPQRSSQVETLVTTGTVPDEVRLVSNAGALVTIHVERLGPSAASVVVVDERGGIVARRRIGELALRLRLDPGRYVARALSRDGITSLGTVSFEVGEVPVEVALSH